jgi:catechol 2,3-dioxygenase-like lactoylglutathione lyase family enzyme/quercetin dioxygenase-like cupin family protein
MNIIGLDSLIFGVDDVDGCIRYLTDYGLAPINVTAAGGCFEALDGTSVQIRHKNDARLPPPMATASMLRKTIYGVADARTLSAIAAELGKDREVKKLAGGALEVTDDMGFVLGFQITIRRSFSRPAEAANAPGAPVQRRANLVAVDENAVINPRTLSHVVYFVPDFAKAEAFYGRLGFRCTDRFIGTGSFLQPAGSLDHHSLFLIQTPPFMKGCEHFTFHLAGPTELMQAGSRFANKGYQSFWGPGRHRLGSNWFWYFNSPLGCHVEYDADMDLHDASWVAREVPLNADNSQLFLFQQREKWVPGGPPPSVRRIVTGHNAAGHAIIQSDGPPDRTQVLSDSRATFHEIWNTRETPARIDRASAEPPEAKLTLLPPKNGTRIRVLDIPPESADLKTMDSATARKHFAEIGAPEASTLGTTNARHAYMHRTESIDYGIVLEGEVTLIVDDGETNVSAGDIVIQRGTNHSWANRSGKNCRIAFILIDGQFTDALRF